MSNHIYFNILIDEKAVTNMASDTSAKALTNAVFYNIKSQPLLRASLKKGVLTV